MQNTRDFSNLAYAKINLNYDAEAFAAEYDRRILPLGTPISNSVPNNIATAPINKLWGMVPPDEYAKADTWEQPGNAMSMNYIKKERPQWRMVQLMELDINGVEDPLIRRFSKLGGPSIRNETLDPQYRYSIKPYFADLQIYQWIQDNLPMQQIRSLHCVSIEPGGLATIHRDSKGFYSNKNSQSKNRIYKNGYVIINLNISNGGGPLWWCLDGREVLNPQKADDPIYITNDYFMHAVPIMTSRRRQIRVMGVPKPELWDLLEHNGMIEIASDYQYNDDDNYGLEYVPK
jgi:hypothetical protein